MYIRVINAHIYIIFRTNIGIKLKLLGNVEENINLIKRHYLHLRLKFHGVATMQLTVIGLTEECIVNLNRILSHIKVFS